MASVPVVAAARLVIFWLFMLRSATLAAMLSSVVVLR